MSKEATVTVEVRAVREGGFWVLHLSGGGVTQVRTLREVTPMVQDYVSLLQDVPADTVRVEVVEIDPGAGTAEEVSAARRTLAEAQRVQALAAQQLRRAVTSLRGQGLRGVEIAQVLGVSAQRVSQLSAENGTEAAGRGGGRAGL